MLNQVAQLGDLTLKRFYKTVSVAGFALSVFWHALLPQSYHPAMRMVLVKQIYFTAVQVLPVFVLIAFIFGSIIIGSVIILASELGLLNEIGSILVYFIFNEFSPFFTALLVALRSGAAVNTEISLMHVNHELDALTSYQVNLIDYLFLPRILSGVVSVTGLAIVFSFIMLVSGYLFSLFFMQMELTSYLRILLNAVSFDNILMLLLKSMTFGFFIMLLPIHSGLKTGSCYSDIPVAVLKGMVSLFVALFVIEAVSLLIWLV
ncbi:ABC transporter permease [Hydrogenovibrio sp. SC-1]|uniref:MlaE family ABC transporter permease n=1 Tax=Hydrogenovibrio sp. SC-1 TaxID=2065820 RepID=UPI000C7E36C2|nr:ABC transporter permease [Hydrogenovibrio sp. SC-1]PLA74133.1 ABC transporter permease [Hydrogenovibrio sp. SC-1]